MKKKHIIYLFLVLILILFLFWFFKLREKKEKISFFEVKRGTVEKVVSESGTLKKGDLINLSFEISGKIEKIFVKEGDKVKKGDILAKLDSSELEIQLKKAEIQLKEAKATLEKLLSGPKEEEIEAAEVNLRKAKEDFENFPSQVSSSFDYFYVKLKEVKDQLQILKDLYFSDPLSYSQNFRKEKEKIEREIKELETEKENVSLSNVKEKIERVKEILDFISSSLTEMRKIMEDTKDMKNISQENITLLDTQKEIVNSLISQNLSLETNYNLLKSTLESAQKNLDLLLSKPKKEDIEIYEAKVKEAETQILLLEKNLEKTKLKSPVSGVVARVFKEEGERVETMMGDIVFQILPEKNFEIEVDIYEEDITKIKIGDPVEITFPAIEDKVFSGKVSFIDPVEKIKDGIVYYGIKILPENLPENVLPGMSCDVKIIVAKKENVLIVPEDIVRKKGSEYFVEIFEKGKILERKIRVGIWGEDFVEVLEGLKEGEKVVLP